jgi:hypothetical protein
MRAMETIWTNEEAEFHGEFVSPTRSGRGQSRPAAASAGHARRRCPIGDRARIDYADEWMPHLIAANSHRDRIDDFWQMCEAHGRDRLRYAVRHARGRRGLDQYAAAASRAACSDCRGAHRSPARPRQHAEVIVDFGTC